MAHQLVPHLFVNAGHGQPSRKSVPQVVWSQIVDSGAAGGATPARLDLSASVVTYCILKAAWRAEHSATRSGKQTFVECGKQRHASILAPLGVAENKPSLLGIDIAPFQAERLAH